MCTVKAGSSQASSEIQLTGPWREIVDTAVCSGADAPLILGGLRSCPRDESDRPIAGAGHGAVVCNAVFPDGEGLVAKLTMLHDGEVVSTTSFTVQAPVAEVALKAPSEGYPTPLKPGRYECRFALGRPATVVRRFFTVVNATKPIVPTAAEETQAVVEILRELNAERAESLEVECVSNSVLQQAADNEPGMITLGEARVKGNFILLDREVICTPLATYVLSRPTAPLTVPVVRALDAVAHEYGHTLGLKRENVVECFAAKLVWKWVGAFQFSASERNAAREFLLDNSHRPQAYKLDPSCTLSA